MKMDQFICLCKRLTDFFCHFEISSWTKHVNFSHSVIHLHTYAKKFLNDLQVWFVRFDNFVWWLPSLYQESQQANFFLQNWIRKVVLCSQVRKMGYRTHHRRRKCKFLRIFKLPDWTKVLYMCSSFWLLGVESRDFYHAEKERTACKAEQIHKMTIIFTQNGPIKEVQIVYHLNSLRSYVVIVSENSCHFVNLPSFASSSFFLSLRKITWLNSQ